jgi:UDP-N-acetylglucosamine--N-acetylmuramyl-(pentapeptide) pyrophosphoryl-undecaprenol N-acetylglucosamine transferase
MEARLVPAAGLPFAVVTARKFSRGRKRDLLTAAGGVAAGFGQAFRLLRRFRPQVVVGTGGYVCAPVVLAASLSGIPTVLHEQNAVPGLTNRLLASFVSVVCTTFDESARRFPPGTQTCHTGLPVRREVWQLTREEAVTRLGLDPLKKTVLAVGGSLGARRLNEAMLAVHRYWQGSREVQILHVTGEADHADFLRRLKEAGIYPAKSGNITVVSYLHHLPQALAASDLVVARAGASFLAEVTARGVAAVLVPYPFAAENHQEYNARALLRAGACEMILERDLTPQGLLEKVRALVMDDRKREDMAARSRALGRPEAGQRILEVLWEVAGNTGFDAGIR